MAPNLKTIDKKIMKQFQRWSYTNEYGIIVYPFVKRKTISKKDIETFLLYPSKLNNSSK